MDFGQYEIEQNHRRMVALAERVREWCSRKAGFTRADWEAALPALVNGGMIPGRKYKRAYKDEDGAVLVDGAWWVEVKE